MVASPGAVRVAAASDILRVCTRGRGRLMPGALIPPASWGPGDTNSTRCPGNRQPVFLATGMEPRVSARGWCFDLACAAVRGYLTEIF